VSNGPEASLLSPSHRCAEVHFRSEPSRRFSAVFLVVSLGIGGCGPGDPHTEAARLDRRFGTHVYTWLVDHDPSRLRVAGPVPADPAPFVPDGSVRSVSSQPREACRQARRGHALLLAFVSQRDARRRSAMLDCGFAIERDAAALVIAPE